jgi:hypothetical protein
LGGEEGVREAVASHKKRTFLSAIFGGVHLLTKATRANIFDIGSSGGRDEKGQFFLLAFLGFSLPLF